MKLNLGVEDRRGICPGGFLYGGTMGGAGDRKGRPYEKAPLAERELDTAKP